MSTLQSPLTSGASVTSISTLSSATLPQLSSLPIASTSRGHSPSSGSGRTGSGSPATMTVAYPASPHTSMEPATWDEQIFHTGLSAKDDQESSASTSQSYSSIPPGTSPTSHTPSYTNPRHSMPNLYPHTMNTQHQQQQSQQQQQPYPHSTDRPLGSAGAGGAYSSSPYILRDVNPDRRIFNTYTQAYATHSGGLHSPTVPGSLPQPSMAGATSNSAMSAQSSQSYTHRRSITDPHGVRTAALSHHPPITHSQHSAPQAPVRLPSPSETTQGADVSVAHYGGYQMSGERRGGRMH